MKYNQHAKQVFNSLLLAFQTFKLFPEKCQSRRQAVAKLHSELVSFLTQNGVLRLEIQKQEVFYLGEVIYEKTGRNADFIFILYQEGIKWVEFRDGIGIDEIERLFEILDMYSRPDADEKEDDLVTRLWEAQFANIAWQDSMEADSLPELDRDDERIAIFKEKTVRQICSHLLSLPEDPEFAGSSSGNDPGMCELTPEEESLLYEMREEEKSLDPLVEMFVACAYACDHENQREFLLSLLDFMRDGINQAMKSMDIRAAKAILMGLRQLSKLCDHNHWAYGRLENIFSEISKSEALCTLIAGMKDHESYRLNDLKEFLTALNPVAIHRIVQGTLKAWSSDLRRILIEAITALATLDIEELTKFSKNADKNVHLIIIEVLGDLKTRRATEILLRYGNHPLEDVVVCALRTLPGMAGWFPYQVFDLIDHHSDIVRMIALEHLGSRKCQTAEKLLIGYLASRRFKRAEKAFALQCFKSLGNCGSFAAYAFFRDILLNQKWYRKVFGSVEAKRAALGLQAMGTEEAMNLLDKSCPRPILRLLRMERG